MKGGIILIVAAAAFALTSTLGIWLIPVLRRLRYGQTINDIGPVWHHKKEGTPTMGGVLFAVGILTASCIGWAMYRLGGGAGEPPSDFLLRRDSARFFLGLGMAAAFGGIGFLDDYIKVVKKRNLGLKESQKLILQCLVTACYLTALYAFGDQSTVFFIPFWGILDAGVFYYPIAAFIIVGTVNAVNLTDGLDGLCSSVTFVAALGMMMVCSLLGFHTTGIQATALAGGCLGFLVWNFYPAKVFMGDLGSMFLGGMMVALAFGTGTPVLLALVGIVYVAEALSVLIQRVYFKLTHGERLFKMTPIHHHFEMSGYSEIQITALFSLLTAAGCVLAVLAVRRM
ncbi:MAG: phospho-N-acetylmuramoyl-pentapeptide-transferase [Oscillospiraceae bacterium]|jgi:phospho-N-acetylmuramoyl-pentapeptide-transferase|nr:phospho-N-acetylmuramoyl-pentapeptide-transferase [Oscillospiraceae bacterium]